MAHFSFAWYSKQKMGLNYDCQVKGIFFIRICTNWEII